MNARPRRRLVERAAPARGRLSRPGRRRRGRSTSAGSEDLRVSAAAGRPARSPPHPHAAGSLSISSIPDSGTADTRRRAPERHGARGCAPPRVQRVATELVAGKTARSTSEHPRAGSRQQQRRERAGRPGTGDQDVEHGPPAPAPLARRPSPPRTKRAVLRARSRGSCTARRASAGAAAWG